MRLTTISNTGFLLSMITLYQFSDICQLDFPIFLIFFRKEITMYSNLEILIKEKGITASRLAKELKFSPTTLYDWRDGRSAPKADKLQLIADYFGVSVDWLIGNSDERNPAIKNGYYNDPETAALAEKLRTNSDMKMLFDASEDLPAEDMQLIYDMVKRLRDREKGE